jgi:hypothetical protein
MKGFPVSGRAFLTVVVSCAALAFPPAAQASGFDALRDHDAAAETAAPADAAFAEACRKSARERLDPQRIGFDRPAHSARDGRRIVRMDLLVPGQRRDPERVFRAVCVRESAGQAVDAMIFDAPADGVGPRVVAIPGPTPDMRPRPPAPADPQPLLPYAVYGPGYAVYGLPGLAVPDDRIRHRRHGDFGKRSRSSITGSGGSTFRFAAPKPKSGSTRFGSRATTRMGTGAFIR